MGKQIIAGIGWELVNDCVQLDGGDLPNFSIIPNNTTVRHRRHQVSVNGPLYALLAEEKMREAAIEIRYCESPASISWKKGLGR